MSLASAYGLQFNLPQDSMASRPVRGGLAQAQPEGDNYGQDDLLGSDLYVKEGMTDEYYKKVAGLKSFANEVSARYGYDVTRPNYRDRESIRFHKAYLESLADIQASHNELKGLKSQENIAIQRADTQMKTFADGSTRAINTGENDLVKGLATAAKGVKNPDEAEGFELSKQALVQQLQEELASATDNVERAELQETLKKIELIVPNTGITPYERESLDLQDKRIREDQRYRQQMLNQKATPTLSAPLKKAASRLETMDKLATPSDLEAAGLRIVQTAAGTFLERKNTQHGQDTKRVKVDPNNPSAFMNVFNRLINEDKSSSQIGIDDINALEDFGINLEEFSSALMARLDPQASIAAEVEQGSAGLISRSATDQEAGKKMVKLLSQGSKLPSEVGAYMGLSMDSEEDIKGINISYPKFFGSPKLNIKLAGKKKGETRSKSLSLDDPEDMKMIQEILRFNTEYMGRDAAMDAFGLNKEGAAAPAQKAPTVAELVDIM